MAVISDVIDDGTVVLQYRSSRITREGIVTHKRQHLADPRITPGASVLVDA